MIDGRPFWLLTAAGPVLLLYYLVNYWNPSGRTERECVYTTEKKGDWGKKYGG